MFSKNVLRSIDANRTIKDKIVQSISSGRSRLHISVTDLINPMQSYYRWIHPEIKPPIDKLHYILSGTGFHEIFSDIVSTEEYVEQLLEYKGIVGKVDIFEDIPIELKTTGSIPTDLYKEKLSYIEQLGMYCAMADCDKGQLIIYKRGNGRKKAILEVFDITYFNIEKIKTNMLERKAIFQDALANKNPDDLPKCEWYKKRCDYSKHCNCSTASLGKPIVNHDEITISSNEDALAHFTSKLLEERAFPVDEHLTLDNLIFPRNYVLSKTNNVISNEPNVQTQMAIIENTGFTQALVNAIGFGSKENFNSVEVSRGMLRDRVSMLYNIPFVIETVETDTMIGRKDLASIFPHYFNKLAFISALTKSRKSRLILYYQNIYKNKFMVYDVIFQNGNEILQELDKRINDVTNTTDHTTLPKCPESLFKYCQYLEVCECSQN